MCYVTVAVAAAIVIIAPGFLSSAAAADFDRSGPRYGPPRYAYPGPPPWCEPQWQCGRWGCAWRQVCFGDVYTRPLPPYRPPAGYGYLPY
jgi:hypothetical protein